MSGDERLQPASNRYAVMSATAPVMAQVFMAVIAPPAVHKGGPGGAKVANGQRRLGVQTPPPTKRFFHAHNAMRSISAM